MFRSVWRSIAVATCAVGVFALAGGSAGAAMTGAQPIKGATGSAYVGYSRHDVVAGITIKSGVAPGKYWLFLAADNYVVRGPVKTTAVCILTVAADGTGTCSGSVYYNWMPSQSAVTAELFKETAPVGSKPVVTAVFR
jgi:hypothetical protein